MEQLDNFISMIHTNNNINKIGGTIILFLILLVSTEVDGQAQSLRSVSVFEGTFIDWNVLEGGNSEIESKDGGVFVITQKLNKYSTRWKVDNWISNGLNMDTVSLVVYDEMDCPSGVSDDSRQYVSCTWNGQDYMLLSNCDITEVDTIAPYYITDVMPQFPGGEVRMMEFIRRNMKYPNKMLENGRQGRVVVQFVVERDGSLSNLKIIKSVNSDFDTEALRIISEMPNWECGRWFGHPVRVIYTIPINFYISTSAAQKTAEPYSARMTMAIPFACSGLRAISA